MFHKIMVAYDESSEAARALRASIDLAKALRAELNVVTVLEPIPGYYSFAVSAVPAFQLPTSWAPRMKPSWISVRRVRPLHMTVFPGGGSFARASEPPRRAGLGGYKERRLPRAA